MIDRFALWLPVAVLLLLAVLTFWIEQSVKDAANRGGINLEEPDSIVENFQAESTDVSGTTRYRLTAERLRHYSDNKLTLLDNPSLTHIHDKQGEMKISSRTASVSPEGEKVVFSGEVNFLRPANGGRSELSLRTSRLDVLTQKSQVMTNEPVTIQQPGLQITANGLHLYGNTRVLKLKGRVKARYQNANRA